MYHMAIIYSRCWQGRWTSSGKVGKNFHDFQIDFLALRSKPLSEEQSEIPAFYLILQHFILHDVSRKICWE